MPQTPDRFPGERQDEGLALATVTTDPTSEGVLRYITDRFRFYDTLGAYTGRPVYVSTSAPTATDDDSSGFSVGVLWLNTTSGKTYICTDNTNTAAVWTPLTFPRTIDVPFLLTEDVNNTTRYFTTYRSPGGDSVGPKRSLVTGGIQFQNFCSPFHVPWDANIYRALLVLKGAGVQNGSVIYPVTYQTELYRVASNFNSVTKVADINFSISNSFTVGTWSVGVTDFKGALSLDIDVDENDLLGLRFVNGTGASLVGQTRNAFVTLILEER